MDAKEKWVEVRLVYLNKSCEDTTTLACIICESDSTVCDLIMLH